MWIFPSTFQHPSDGFDGFLDPQGYMLPSPLVCSCPAFVAGQDPATVQFQHPDNLASTCRFSKECNVERAPLVFAKPSSNFPQVVLNAADELMQYKQVP